MASSWLDIFKFLKGFNKWYTIAHKQNDDKETIHNFRHICEEEL